MDASYVPWLHMHQPMVWQGGKLVSNLEKMLDSPDSQQSGDAKKMLRAYKNPATYCYRLSKEGFSPKMMLDFSGLLLETLSSMGERLATVEVDGEKVGDIIAAYKKVFKAYPKAIEFAGTAYSHCYFPITPKVDWEMQITEWRKTFSKLFGSSALKQVHGFWLPEQGVPGGKDLERLIHEVKKAGYHWLILPTEAIEGEKKFSWEKRVSYCVKPWILKQGKEKIPVIFRMRYDFIDQQAGCDAKGVYEKALSIQHHSGKVPALVCPASDGENGNVMMNQFFKDTFVPFFTKLESKKVGSMLVSQFLEKYYPYGPKEEVKLKVQGGSWTGSHSNWTQGERREQLRQKVEALSKSFHRKKQSEKALQALLLAETSCYLYWNVDFWFDQGEMMVNYAKRLQK